MQQFPFIDLFKSATHVSGDKIAHPQEHFWLYIQILVQCTDIAADRWPVHCTKICIYSQKCSWGWAILSPETCVADLKRSINGNCCILLIAYIVILMIHGLTNVKFIFSFEVGIISYSVGKSVNFFGRQEGS